MRELGPTARTKEIKDRLADVGISVTSQQISNEKARLSKQANPHSLGLTVATLKRVKKLVDELGSTAIVREALDELDELLSKDT